MINKLEERKKKKESIYKVKIFTGMVLLALIITGILMYSKVDTTAEYPLEYYTIGEASRDIFNEHSGLMLTDIIYESEPIEVVGSQDDLQNISDVVIEVDMFTINEYLEMPSEEELAETEGQDTESAGETTEEDEEQVETEESDEPESEGTGDAESNEEQVEGESEESESTESEDQESEEQVEGETGDPDMQASDDEGTEESVEGQDNNGSAEFVVDEVTETQGFIEMSEDGYMLVELPIKVIGYNNQYLPLETSQDSIVVNLKVDKVVQNGSETEEGQEGQESETGEEQESEEQEDGESEESGDESESENESEE